MGTAKKIDPTKLEITTLDKTNYDPLAKVLRKKVRDLKINKKIYVVLFSDYDGTIKTFDKYANYFEKRTFKKNIDAIDKFLGNGNKFIITTKRNTYSILEELEKYKINYSYLTTYNGRVTLDSKNNIKIGRASCRERV